MHSYPFSILAIKAMNPDNYKGKYRIPSNRLQGFDYGSNAAYFVTICTYDKVNYLGEVVTHTEPQNLAALQDSAVPQALVHLSEMGKVAYQYWLEIPQHFPFVILDEFIIMPNHIHGILIFNKTEPVEPQDFAAHNITQQKPNKFGPQSRNLGSIIRGYKAAVKKHATLQDLDMYWQERYHDRIIRSAKEHQNIAQYIYNNPLNWQMDEDNQAYIRRHNP